MPGKHRNALRTGVAEANNKPAKIMKTFRILEDGNHYWQGRAHDADHALERCYDDGGPGSLVKVTLEEWRKVKLSKTLRAPGWVKVWEGQYCLG